MTLDILRKEIDAIDAQILDLLAKRLHVAKEIAQIKKIEHLPILDEQREQRQLEEIKNMAIARGLSPPIVEDIFTSLFKYSCSVQKKEIENG